MKSGFKETWVHLVLWPGFPLLAGVTGLLVALFAIHVYNEQTKPSPECIERVYEPCKEEFARSGGADFGVMLSCIRERC